MEKIKLFCFPYAGSSAVAYSSWKKHLGSEIEVIPVELAGRGLRFSNPFYNTFNEMVEDVYSAIKDEIDDKPYAFFGHSMGSWLAYELAHKIIQNNHNNPMHIFFSARWSPQIYKEDIKLHELTVREVKDALRELGGTPEEILEDKKLFNAFLPVLLADFKVMSTFKYNERQNKLHTSISVLSGKDDYRITHRDLLAWKEHSDIGCKIYKIAGGHFFINENIKDVVDIIKNTLLEI